MPVRNRNGKLEWRFKLDGHEYSHITDLGDTPRNRTKAQRMEAEARKLVLDGRASELRITQEPFNSAADAFKVWSQGEYSSHPGSWKRLAVSMTSAKVFFGRRPVSGINRGDVEDYKSWRRTVHKVREITLRHDLHALSLLFQYADKHNWARTNPVRQVSIPSDANAVRINVLSPAQERAYFDACLSLMHDSRREKRTKEARGLQDLYDLHTLMLHQGCRPEELRELEQRQVDLVGQKFTIISGKSKAARRTLRSALASVPIFVRRLTVPGRWVFPSQKVAGGHIGTAQRLHAAVVKKSGVRCVPYDFRHTCATRWAEAGVDIAAIAAWLGHANLRSVQKYIHPSQQHLDEAMLRYDRARAEAEAERRKDERLQ